MAEAAAADPSKEQNNPEETARSGQADLVPADSLNPAAEPVKPTEETINVKGENLRDPEKGRWVKEISVSFRNPVAGTLFINQTEGEPRITEPANGKFLGRIMVGADFGIQKNLLRWLAVQGSSGLFFQRDYLGFSRNAARETRVLFQGNRMVFLKETENRSGYTQTLRLGGQAGLGLVFLPGNRLPEIRVRAGGLFSLAGENRYSWDGKVSDKRSGLAFSGLYIQVSAVRHFSFAGSDCWVEPQFLLLPDPSFRYNGGIARQVHYFGIGLGCRLPQK
jgi:hypothetical protein